MPPLTEHTIEGIARALEGALAAVQSQARIALRTTNGQETRHELRELLVAADLAGAPMRLLLDFARYQAVARL